MRLKKSVGLAILSARFNDEASTGFRGRLLISLTRARCNDDKSPIDEPY